MAGILKRMVVGRPLATTQMEEQRLPKTIALAVFSSDALSSTAYATEEILFVVAVGGSSLALGLSRLVPIALVVAALLAIVIISYRQVIFAYPGGGGAYVVSQENIGEMASLIAGASLMVDYVLTVAVSISAGVAAIVSIPALSGLADQHVRRAGCRAHPGHHVAEHPRHQGIGHRLRDPHVPLHVRVRRSHHLRPHTVVPRRHGSDPVRPPPRRDHERVRRHPHAVPAVEGLLVPARLP